MPALIGMIGKLGDILLSRGWLTPEHLQQATEDGANLPGERLGATLRRLDLVTEEHLHEALAIQYDLPFLELSWRLVDRSIIDVFPNSLIQRNRVIPMFRVENELTVAVDDPTNMLLLDEITRLTGCNVLLVVTSATIMDSFLEDTLEDNFGSEEDAR